LFASLEFEIEQAWGARAGTPPYSQITNTN